MMSNHAGTALRVEGLAKRFGCATALADVSLEVARGERHVLLGENGAGKSTLINILAGERPADGGSILLHGEPYRPASPAVAARSGVAVVRQELSLIADLTVAENIFLGHMPTRWPGWVDRRRLAAEATAMLARLGLDIDPERKAATLPIAVQQLVEIAKGLARNADLLILDEPTSSLGAAEASRLWALVTALHGQGKTIIFVSHKLDEVLANSDRVTVLRDGRSVATLPTPGLTTGRLVELMVGRAIPERAPATSTPGEVLLDVDGLSRRGVFEDVAFTARAGEIVGFAGLVGAGRTEVMRSVLGVDVPDAGTVRVGGATLPKGDPRAALAAGVGLLPENRKEQALFPDLSIRENIAMPGKATGALSLLRFGEETSCARRQVELLGIACRSVEQSAGTLSGGNQQKVALARWLGRDTRVLIVDEPTRGVDVGARAEIYALLRQQVCAGRAVVAVISELPELLSVADRIIVMRGGRIVGEFDREHASEKAVADLALGA